MARFSSSVGSSGSGGDRARAASDELITVASGDAVATIAPRAGLCVVSLVAGGRELLALPAPLAEFLATTRTGGIPLLYPWANRLRGDDLTVRGRRLGLRDSPWCHRDEHGRPIHGLLLRWPEWSIDAVDAEGAGERNAAASRPGALASEAIETVVAGASREAAPGASIQASLDWSTHDELMRAYPFAHRLAVRFDLTASALTISTTIHALDDAVPVSFGWHPYLALRGPTSARRVHLPDRAAIALDESRLPIPADSAKPSPAGDEPLGVRALDALFASIADGASVEITDGASHLIVEFARGYDHMQLYAPMHADFACVEPMTAPIVALDDGASRTVAPGGSFTATWRLRWR